MQMNKVKKQPAFKYEHHPDAFLRPADTALFRAWVKNKYTTVNELSKAWNQYEVGITNKPYKNWDDFYNDPLVTMMAGTNEIIPTVGQEYGKVKDILRFKADMYLELIRQKPSIRLS